MTTGANVLAIHALDELRSALGAFSSEAQQVLGAAAQEIQRTQDWLAERQAHWQREVRRREDILTPGLRSPGPLPGPGLLRSRNRPQLCARL